MDLNIAKKLTLPILAAFLCPGAVAFLAASPAASPAVEENSKSVPGLFRTYN